MASKEQLMTALRNADAAGDADAAARFAQMIRDIPADQTPTFGQRARAVGDVAGAVIGGALAEPVAGVLGVASMPFAGPDGAAKVVQDVQSLPSQVMPKSELGQEYLQNVGGAIDKVKETTDPLWKGTIASLYGAIPFVNSEEQKKLMDALPGEGLSGDLGSAVLEVTGNEELAALASTYPTAAMELFGLKGAKSLKGDIPTSKISTNPKVALSQAVPEVTQLKNQAKELYKEVDDLGVKVAPEKFVDLSIKLRDKFNEFGVDKQLTPDSARLLDRFDETVDRIASDGISVSELDILRQLADVPAKKFDNGREMALGNIAKDYIDEFIDEFGNDMSRQGRVDVGEKIRNARNLWSRASKSDVLTEAMEKAKQQASGFENGLRIQFRQLLNNKKKMRGFSNAEKEAIQKVVQGGGIENTMRALGKFGIFGEGGQTTILPSLIGGPIAATFSGNPVVGVAVPVIGQVSKELAVKMTANNAAMAQSVIRAGDNGLEIAKAYARNIPKSQQSVADLTELLMRQNVDLNTIKEMAGEFGTMVNDAKFAAEFMRDAGLTSLMFAPGAETGIEEANKQ